MFGLRNKLTVSMKQWQILYSTMIVKGPKIQKDFEENLKGFHVKLDELWTPEESLFKLNAILCLPEMNEVLETCRVLAKKSKRLNEVACFYAKNGKIVGLTVLLIVARKKVMLPIC